MIDPGEEQLILPDDLEPVEMGRMLPEDQEAARKTLLEENGGLCRVGWPLVLMITNAYVGAGCLPTYVGLAILAANKEPDFVSGLEVPHVVWAINTIILVGSIIGFIAGFALWKCTDGFARKMLVAQGVNVFIAFGFVVSLLVSAGVYPTTEFAEDNTWSIVVYEIYVAYSSVQYCLWGVLAVMAFKLRRIFDSTPESSEVPAPTATGYSLSDAAAVGVGSTEPKPVIEEPKEDAIL